MEWGKANKKEGNNFQIPETWLLPHYYEVLTTLFRIENALRVFVFSILKNELRERWIDLNIVSDDAEEGTISSIAKKRINQGKDFGYLGYFVSCPIMYLTTGELIRIIINESYWKYFAKYFPGSRTIIETKLKEIINVRNSIAHFRPIKEGDVELIKQNAVHVLSSVETCILQLINCRNVVPTNTKEGWYKELKKLATDNVAIDLFFSGDEEWLRIELTYICPIIEKQILIDDEYISYKLLTIISPVVLKKYTILINNIIYMSEGVTIARKDAKYDADFYKKISIVISKENIIKKYKEMCPQISALLTEISEETELIKQDDLAKGEIVKAVYSYAMFKQTADKKGYWSFGTELLSCNVEEDSPSEFWGIMNFPYSHFISDTHKYPWMPVEIAQMKLPW